MSDKIQELPIGSNRFQGYKSDPVNAGAEFLSQPCENMMITENGAAAQRLGYQSEFSIGVSNKTATCLYVSTYDVVFFALGTKVYYYNFNDDTSYDTGLTLTTGTTTRMWEWFGMVFLSNTTDGLRMITIGRLNDASATAGDANVTIDLEMGGKLTAFNSITAIGSSSLRINGIDEPMTSIATSTGVVTLDGTLSQSYEDNTVCIVTADISSGREKASKGMVWKSRFHLFGYPSVSNADSPNNTVIAGDFVIGSTGATGIEGILTFGGSAGSTKINVPYGGKVTNVLAAKEFIYFFTENSVFGTASSDVADSGSSIGLTIPNIKDELHGCINEDCATIMGNNAMTYVSPDKRIMRIPIDTYTGAVVSKPEEDFDVDIRGHLKNMDKDQTGARVFHYRGGRQTIYQLKIAGQWKWFIYDQNIIRQSGSNVFQGAWQPPQNITPATDFFERDGVLYGTDTSTDTVYSYFTVFTDNLVPIQATFATGELSVGQAMMKKAQLWGDVNQPSQVNIKCYVWNNIAGKRSGTAKVVNGSSFSYSEGQSVGAVPVGGAGAVGATTQTAKWRKDFEIFPSEATRVQLTAENFQDGGWFSISGFNLTGTQSPDSFSYSS